MAQDYYIHGGVFEKLDTHGGNVHFHGGVVEQLNTQGGNVTQLGGIIEKRVILASDKTVIMQTAEQYAKPYAEEISKLRRENEELKKRISGIGKLESLKAYNTLLSRQNDDLKKKISELNSELSKRKDEPEELPSDDVLVRRIISLQNELESEKAAHKKEVEELQYRLDGALEVNAKLRMGIKDTDHRSEEIADKHIDILATLMSLYPFTPDGDLEMEFGLPRNKIKYIAQVLGGIKSKEARMEAVQYLAKQDRELIQRRGGAQINHFSKPVEQVSKNGRVMNTFISAADAHEATGFNAKTIRNYCQRYGNKKLRTYTKQGFTFRYKFN